LFLARKVGLGGKPHKKKPQKTKRNPATQVLRVSLKKEKAGDKKRGRGKNTDSESHVGGDK